jgi:mono/diheme cytochrome c family protein
MAAPPMPKTMATVTGGRNDMPSFADDLSTDEIRAVVAYVRGMIESR